MAQAPKRPAAAVDTAELLARDLSQVAKPANLFRFRIDPADVVIDFGYLPPVMEDEIPKLIPEAVGVHTRLVIPSDLAKQMAERLLASIQEAEKLAPK